MVVDLFNLQPFSTSFSIDKRVEPNCYYFRCM